MAWFQARLHALDGDIRTVQQQQLEFEQLVVETKGELAKKNEAFAALEQSKKDVGCFSLWNLCTIVCLVVAFYVGTTFACFLLV